MNYASSVLGYLSEAAHSPQVLLVSGAPPVARKGDDLDIVFNSILTPQDIRETLGTFTSHVSVSGGVSIGSQGVFSFGISNMGRFRVHYFTQRGSMVVAVWKVPAVVPDLESLIEDAAVPPNLQAMFTRGVGGIGLIFGAVPSLNALFAYSLLSRINRTAARIIYIVEQDLSYLLRHNRSVVLQSEVDADLKSIEDGIANGAFFALDIMYVREPKSKPDFLGLIAAAGSGILVLLSLVAPNEHALKLELTSCMGESYGSFCGFLREVVEVRPAKPGRMSVRFVEPQQMIEGGPGTPSA